MSRKLLIHIYQIRLCFIRYLRYIKIKSDESHIIFDLKSLSDINICLVLLLLFQKFWEGRIIVNITIFSSSFVLTDLFDRYVKLCSLKSTYYKVRLNYFYGSKMTFYLPYCLLSYHLWHILILGWLHDFTGKIRWNQTYICTWYSDILRAQWHLYDYQTRSVWKKEHRRLSCRWLKEVKSQSQHFDNFFVVNIWFRRLRDFFPSKCFVLFTFWIPR